MHSPPSSYDNSAVGKCRSHGRVERTARICRTLDSSDYDLIGVPGMGGARSAKRSGGLQAELRALDRIRRELGGKHASQWVIVRNGVAVGLFVDFQSAATEAAEKYPDGKSLIAPLDERAEPRVASVLGARR